MAESQLEHERENDKRFGILVKGSLYNVTT